MNIFRFYHAVLFCLLVGVLHAQNPRIGWEESFDDISKWKAAMVKPNYGSPLDSVTAEDGSIRLVTPVGALNPKMKRKDWPEWPEKPASSFTNFSIRYDDVVDLDVYRYFVIRILEKATFFYISINGKALKVGYTTGIHSQDLRALGLRGKQRVSFYGQFLNSHGHVKIDYIRLVRELTPDENRGFIGDGLTIRKENLAGHPYHRLEALNTRAGRPSRRPGSGSEWVAYRDAGTGAEIWRMTDLTADEQKVHFNCDGSAFTVSGRPGRGLHVFDWTDRQFKLVEGGLSDAHPRFSTNEPDAMIIAENKWFAHRKRRITIWRLNFRTGEKSKMASFEPRTWVVQEFGSSPDSSKMTFGLRESRIVFLIDPEIPDINNRVREITLSTRLKGVRLTNNDTELQWANCYTYQRLIMNLKTGKVSQGNSPCAGGHSAGGPYSTIGPYSNLMKLLVRNGLHPQAEKTAGDTSIFANYREPVVTDYGHVSRNGKWMVTNGTAGDVRGQHVMISTSDPATVLRTCFYNTSRNNWATNTYSSTSPDATKLAYISDQFGNGNVHIAITGRPAPPANLRASREGDGVKLSWEAPKGARENGGYRIYRSKFSGRSFVALNRKPVTSISYVDKTPGPGPLFYLVAVVEPSGLEGHFSNEAAVDVPAKTPRVFLVEAENGEWSAPLREVLHGSASGSRYIRYHRAGPDEPDEGILKYRVTLPDGKFTVWLRTRNEAGGEQWRWHKTENDAQSGEIKVTRDGQAIDQICLTNDPAANPGTTPGMTTSPEPASALRASATPQSIKLRWAASPAVNIARYDIHAGDEAEEFGNQTILGSTVETTFMDWGLRPGTEYTFHVVAVDSRGNHSEPKSIRASTQALSIQTFSVTPPAENKASFTFDVKSGSPFILWASYRPAYVTTKQLRVGVELDGKAIGNWQLRAPYRPMGWTLAKQGKGADHVFVDKVAAGDRDVYSLPKGPHTVTFKLDPKLGKDDQHAFEKLILTNDHSHRPEGYDPRADFKKTRRVY